MSFFTKDTNFPMSKSNLLYFAFFSLFLFAIGCQKEATSSLDTDLTQLLTANSQGNGLDFFILPNETDFSKIPQDPKNPITAEKVALGKALFHETGLGMAPKHKESTQTYSCASCHHVDAGFQAGVAQGIGEGGLGFGLHGEKRVINPIYPLADVDVQPIRSPAALNTAFQELMLWNGQFGAVGKNIGTNASWTVGTPKEKNNLGFHGVETQAVAGQGVHRLKVEYCDQNPTYLELFRKAYPTMPAEKRINDINAGMAIAAYERTILANKAPFQRWLRGEKNAMTEQEKEGAILFFGKANCVKCHTGPALNSMDFYALGMNDLTTGTYGAINADENKAEHKGRGGFTGKDEDMFKFKVPQLYNLKGIEFLGHGAQFRNVKEVLEYKNKGVASNAKVPSNKLSPEFKPLNLTALEIQQIQAFIENALFDPNLQRYVPDFLPSLLCFPNNDLEAKKDRSCW